MHDYDICGVIGADYSPTCGVNITSKGNWCGEFNDNNPYEEKIKSLHTPSGMGVMMEELREMLELGGIITKYLAINELDMSSYQEVLKAM